MASLSRRGFALCALTLVSALLFSGCAGLQPKNQTLVWASRGQFVTIVDGETPSGESGAANQQPVTLSGARLRAELATIQVRLPGEEKPLPVFGEGELENLGDQLPVALAKAGPGQDVIFAVIGEQQYLKGLVHKDYVTTGRAFYRDNRLNLVLGLVRQPVQGQDRRLQPFTPGSRLHPTQLSGPLSATSPAVVFEANRPDWLSIALPPGMDEKPAQQVSRPADQVPVQAAEKPAPVPAPPSKEATGPAESPAQAQAPRGKEAAGPARSIQERLQLLHDLKAKGLITDEEYRAKKQSILKEL